MLHIANPIYDSVFNEIYKMNIEEEFNTVLEKRDTEIMLYKKEVSEAKRLVAEKDEQIASAIRQLHTNGMDDEMIASSFGISINDVMRITRK